MKVGIIAANNLCFSPYVFYYTKILDELNIDYEIIAPNRNPKIQDIQIGDVYYIDWNQKSHSIINYFKLSHEAKKIAKKKYDYVIVLTTINAVFSYKWLKKYYKHKYIVDIRDYTYEYNRIFYYLEKKAVLNSKLNVISSKKFMTFLPEAEYYVCHNINTPINVLPYNFEKSQTKIIIGYVGAVAYAEQCKKIMDLIKKDDRFEFHIYGTGVAENEVFEYKSKLNCERIKMYGKYSPKEKENIIKKVDILFNAYGYGRPLVDCAISNKLYDALYYHKPILTSPHTYMHEMGGYISYAIDLLQVDNLNDLWKWYQNINQKIFDDFSTSLYKTILNEAEETERQIKKMFESMKNK